MHFHISRSSTNSSGSSKAKGANITDDPPPYSQLDARNKGGFEEESQYTNYESSSTSLLYSIHNLLSIPLKISSLPRQKKAGVRSISKGNVNQGVNEPYIPSQEQQRQIDLLGKSVSEPDISHCASNTQTEYFDVLPSFQMFQSILKRDDNQFSENLNIDPPIYGDTLNTSRSLPESLTPMNSQPSYPVNNIDTTMQELNERLNNSNINEDREGSQGYQFSDNESADGLVPMDSLDSRLTQHVSASYDSYGHSVLDNIDKLPKLKTSPIDIQIYVTKRVPQPHCTSELETRLKEYTSGDVVNGYIVITNTSDKPLDFGLFLVTLEGTIKTVQRDPNADPRLGYKYDKILMKKFLKMYDLNASYGYINVPNSAGIEYTAYTHDTHDGCLLGLPNERRLQPHTSYKKFFTFKFPDKLLDDNCTNSLLPHTLPPPSMGLDRTSFYNRGYTIQLNKALGYGFLNSRGTPLMTKDYGFEDVSVSYTIEAKFIDKLNSNQKDTFSQHEINDPNSDSDYVISKGNQYFLRFIPDLRKQIPYFNEIFSNTYETYASIGIDGKLYENYVNSSTWKLLNELNYRVEKEINQKLVLQELGDDGIKSKNLALGDSNNRVVNTKAEFEQRLRRLDRVNTDLNEIEFYNDNRMIGSKAFTNVFGKKKKTILSSLIKIGELKIYVKVPDKIIPYTAPKLLMRYNTNNFQDDLITPTTTKSSIPDNANHQDDNPLAPISSTSSSLNNHITDLYYRSQDEIIQSVDISLIFIPSDNSTKPPQISSIEANIIFWSYNCDFPLPLELSYDFFYTHPNEKNESNDDVDITRNNLQSLKDKANTYIQYLRDNLVIVSKDAFLYLKSIKSLGFKKDTIKDYYKTIKHLTHPNLLNNEADWKIQQSSDKKMKWTKNLTIPLIPINKGNVNLIPTFQSCLVGRIYCLQVLVKYKGSAGDQNEFADNIVKVDVPVLVG